MLFLDNLGRRKDFSTNLKVLHNRLFIFSFSNSLSVSLIVWLMLWNQLDRVVIEQVCNILDGSHLSRFCFVYFCLANPKSFALAWLQLYLILILKIFLVRNRTEKKQNSLELDPLRDLYQIRFYIRCQGRQPHLQAKRNCSMPHRHPHCNFSSGTRSTCVQ